MSYELKKRLDELRKQCNAVILAHNYQRPEIQDVADFLGDSLGLSRQAAETKADVIVFCGVHFMAETASILCPGRTVLIPDRNAGCPMSDMIIPRELAKFQGEHPGALVVCYVNSSAEIKAMSDVCCTSANAVRVVAALPADQEIIFIPDKNLGQYVARETGRDLILWPGYCPTHQRILPEDVQRLKAAHPDACVVVHPECPMSVIELADVVTSTSGMLTAVRERDTREFVIGTELGLVYRLQRENPDKTFYHISPHAACHNMKLNTLEKVVWSLEDMVYEVSVPEPTASRARGAIKKMLEF